MPELRQDRDLAVRKMQKAEQSLSVPELRLRWALRHSMGEVAVTIRLMPKSADTDLARLEQAVKERVKVHSISREPIAFGLKALQVVAIVQDAAGGTEPLERELAELPGVGNVQVIGLTRLL